jgi:ATP-dependent RNA helicase HelY
MGPQEAHRLLEQSFAQYQADRSVVGLVRGAERGERMLDEIAAEFGGRDAAILDYARLAERISERERAQARASRLQRRQTANDALAALRRGDIITITHGRRGGLAVVLESDRDSSEPRPLVLTEHRWAGRISSADYPGTSAPVGSMTLPKRVEHRQPRVRRDLASALRSAAAGLPAPTGRDKRGARREAADADAALASLRDELRRHPAHRAPDRDASLRVAERYLRIERENAQLQQKVAAATNSLARTFDRIVGLLNERGFIEAVADDLSVTEDGRLLARIYSESDLLVAECLRGGAWTGLGPAELAAAASTVVYEARGSADSRGSGAPPGGREPSARLRQALVRTRRLSATLRADEQRHRITASREPDDGFVDAIYRWASSGDLSAALAAAEDSGSGSALSAGDFVRWCRQVLDLLDQVRNTALEPELRGSAKRAIDAVRRGVVAVDAE